MPEACTNWRYPQHVDPMLCRLPQQGLSASSRTSNGGWTDVLPSKLQHWDDDAGEAYTELDKNDESDIIWAYDYGFSDLQGLANSITRIRVKLRVRASLAGAKVYNNTLRLTHSAGGVYCATLG